MNENEYKLVIIVSAVRNNNIIIIIIIIKKLMVKEKYTYIKNVKYTHTHIYIICLFQIQFKKYIIYICYTIHVLKEKKIAIIIINNNNNPYYTINPFCCCCFFIL
jgi:hypothetical protein